MKCAEFTNMLHDMMDGTLSSEQTERMNEHAASCPGCAERSAALKNALDGCRELGGDAPVPEAVSSAWRRAVKNEGTKKKTRRPAAIYRWEAWAGLAAALLLLTAGAGGFARRDNAAVLQIEMPAAMTAGMERDAYFEAEEAEAEAEQAPAEPEPEKNVRKREPAARLWPLAAALATCLAAAAFAGFRLRRRKH